MSASPYDASGLAFSILGSVGVAKMLGDYVHDKLPAQQMKELDEILNETTTLFQDAVEEGVLANVADFKVQTEENLENIRKLADRLRSQSNQAITYPAQVKTLVQGLSKKISRLTQRTVDLRARIGSISERERKKIEERALAEGGPTSTATEADVTTTLKFRGPQRLQDEFPTLISRHPTYGPYIVNHDRVLEDLKGQKKELEALPNPPKEEEVRHVELTSPEGETVTLDFEPVEMIVVDKGKGKAPAAGSLRETAVAHKDEKDFQEAIEDLTKALTKVDMELQVYANALGQKEGQAGPSGSH
ncbi:hypothetical protein NM688_g78 [Phlebia brevispora]|uniref:Uncharacterized protein n=1 Tax=Phlebia brevispora TaxID=194682 RepID=A0ACC1TF30_9APHY|nr:hypothetical protein NM688_g78 [Phlebia brevispora]